MCKNQCTCPCVDKTCSEYKPVPHKHAEVIKAWANGALIQGRYSHWTKDKWVDLVRPNWHDHCEYRIKPKPDVIRYARASADDVEPIPVPKQWSDAKSSTWWSVRKSGSDNVKAIFDGETGVLKSVEKI